MTNTPLIQPANWQSAWSNQKVKFLEDHLIPQLQFAYIERGYECFIQLWSPGQNPKGSFIAMGLRKAGKQDNGNDYSILFAFGFFYESAINWPDDMVDVFADRNVEEYEDFLSGSWPLPKHKHDDEVLIGNANLSAQPKRARDTEQLTKLSPTEMAESLDCQIKAIDNHIAQTVDPWAEIEAEEEDPLS